MSRNKEVIPSAKRIITSLRDMGYNFSAAVADLIDNSIEADATTIVIDIDFEGEDSYVRISDDGIGMSSEELIEAMRYGSHRNYREEDLGKFGLGLKTASLSQCRKLTVATKFHKDNSKIRAFSWDLDHVERTDKWEILSLEKNEQPKLLREPLENSYGTVVLWQKLDRILRYSKPDGEFARKGLNKMCRDLEEHLAMVFHRFLDGEVEGRLIQIYLNDNPVQGWDPFARRERHTKKLKKKILKINQDGHSGKLRIHPYILPHESNFSTPGAFKRASGPEKWNLQQGFYFYRSNRLVQCGGWSRLRTLDEHLKLARISIDFPPTLDEVLNVNVSKMQVHIPHEYKNEIQKIIKPVIKEAHRAYRGKGQNKAGTSSNNPPDATGPRTGNTEGQNNSGDSTSGNGFSDNERFLFYLGKVEGILFKHASQKERTFLRTIIKKIKEKYES